MPYIFCSVPVAKVGSSSVTMTMMFFGTPLEVLDRAAKEGYSFRVNPECEFFLFNTDDSGNPTTTVHEKAGYLDVGPLDFGENARRDLVLTLEEMGFEIESSHHEKAPAQHEIDFTAGEALDTADDIMTFKFAVRSIAKRFGLYATFMPKPRADLAGSGMHLSFSMYKDGVNLFDVKSGAVSDTAAAFMAGIIAHSEGICAITNPTVNSYKRIMADRSAIATVAWTSDNKKQPVRLRKKFGETKVELRFPDPSANPYLAIAACIAAGLDGVKNSLKLCAEGKDTGKCLPTDLKGALRKFKKDSYICESLGEAFAAKYVELKEEEWNDYMLQVSDWEVARYLHKM